MTAVGRRRAPKPMRLMADCNLGPPPGLVVIIASMEGDAARSPTVAAHPAPRIQGMPVGWSRLVTGVILSAGEQQQMRTQAEDDMRTALRQAAAIAAVSGERSMRRMLGLAHEIYDAMLLLRPEDRARRVRLIDAIFESPARGSAHRRGER